MKITSKQFTVNINQFNLQNISKLHLFYGEDAGMARTFANKLATKLINNDDLAIEKISALKIIEDPSILYDSVLAPSMFSNIKVIIIEDFVDLGQKQQKISSILVDFLDEIDNIDNTYIIVPAIGLDSKSALVKKYENDPNTTSVRCFVDSDFDLKKLIQQFFTEKGKKLEPKGLMYLQNSLGNDRMITLQELEKLDLYTLKKENITLQDCLDCIVSADSVNLFKFCDSIGLGDKNKTQKYLIMLIEEGYDYNMILAVVIRHLKRLLTVKSAAEKNKSTISAEMQKLRPPVFFEKDLFVKQVESQSMKCLEKFVFEFKNLQKDSRLNPQLAKTMIEQAIFNL